MRKILYRFKVIDQENVNIYLHNDWNAPVDYRVDISLRRCTCQDLRTTPTPTLLTRVQLWKWLGKNGIGVSITKWERSWLAYMQSKDVRLKCIQNFGSKTRGKRLFAIPMYMWNNNFIGCEIDVFMAFIFTPKMVKVKR